jgi:hypothetical protein
LEVKILRYMRSETEFAHMFSMLGIQLQNDF